MWKGWSLGGFMFKLALKFCLKGKVSRVELWRSGGIWQHWSDGRSASCRRVANVPFPLLIDVAKLLANVIRTRSRSSATTVNAGSSRARCWRRTPPSRRSTRRRRARRPAATWPWPSTWSSLGSRSPCALSSKSPSKFSPRRPRVGSGWGGLSFSSSS